MEFKNPVLIAKFEPAQPKLEWVIEDGLLWDDMLTLEESLDLKNMTEEGTIGDKQYLETSSIAKINWPFAYKTSFTNNSSFMIFTNESLFRMPPHS